MPDPRPKAGQLVIDVHSCGICGSDLHAKDHADEMADVVRAVGYSGFMRRDTPTVMGHEFSGVVTECGGKTAGFKPGTRVVAIPMVRAGGGVQLTGLAPSAPGGYAEQVVVEAALAFAVPNGLELDIAALTEPMTVALHAVNRSEINKRDTAIVVGCGPVGLAVILQLKAKGVEKIVASDFSPARRALAERCGASIVVDPTVESPYDRAVSRGMVTEFSQIGDRAVGSMAKLRKVPGWQHIFRGAEAFGATVPKRPVIFECVGVRGLIDAVIAAAPLGSRVMLVGMCMTADEFKPAIAVCKEIDLRGVFGYTPLEFHQTLQMLADGKLDVSPLITGKVGLNGVAAAFEALGDPETHAKILIDPHSPEEWA